MLEEFGPKLEHVAGKQNVVADTLSQHQKLEGHNNSDHEEEPSYVRNNAASNHWGTQFSLKSKGDKETPRQGPCAPRKIKDAEQLWHNNFRGRNSNK